MELIPATLSAILSLAMLIVFFVTASNIAAIKRTLMNALPNSQPYIEHYNHGQLNEYLGNKQAALNSYRIALFYSNNVKVPTDTDRRNKIIIEQKISELSQ